MPSGDGIASTLVLQVSDSGAGLDDASAASAFTRGWSTKHDERLMGHGLGLALVGQATSRHHGTIEVGRTADRVPDGGVPGGAVPGGAVPGGAVPGGAVPGDAAFIGAVFTVRLPLGIEVPSE